MTRDHDVTQLSTAELELTMRHLRANLSLITPGSPRTFRSWLTSGQPTPSWPGVPGTRSTAKASGTTAGYFLTHLRAIRVTLTETRRPRDCRSNGG